MTSTDQKQNPTQDGTLDEKWAGIEKSETIVVQFTEDFAQSRPYCMDISWNYPGSGHADRHVQPSFDTAGHFNSDLYEAASRAVNTRTLRVVYPDARKSDMYPRLGYFLPEFMSAIRLNATVRFDKQNLYGFIVTFGGELSTSPKLIQCPAGYDVIADFKDLDMVQEMKYKLYLWDFSEMLHFFLGSAGGFMASEMFMGIHF